MPHAIHGIMLRGVVIPGALLVLTCCCIFKPKPPPPPPGGNGVQAVLVEVDQMQGTPELQVIQTLGGGEVSLAGMFAAADLDMDVVQDESDLPSSSSVSLADLHGLMTAYKSVDAPAGAWKLNVLVVTADEEDPGTLGIMFDYGANDDNDLPREACAVFATAHQGLPGGVAPEMLLTTAHELGHCFNLHHTDWEGSSFFNNATIMSYSLTDSVDWKISDRSIKHVKDHHEKLVKPGAGGLPFGWITPAHKAKHQSQPSESYTVISPGLLKEAARGRPIAKVDSTGGPGRAAATRGAGSPALKLLIAAPKGEFELGEPVTVTVELRNDGDPAKVLPYLDPYLGFLGVEIDPPGDQSFEPFHPAVLKRTARRDLVELKKGESIHSEVKIFFGAEGWTFKAPGPYSVRARYQARYDDKGPLVSNTLEIKFTSPATEAHTARARNLVQSREAGLYLLLEGGDHLKKGVEQLRSFVKDAPDSKQAPACRLALATGALRPTVDPKRRVRPEARIDVAKQYLQGILDAKLSPQATVRAQKRLYDALKNKDRGQEAEAVRKATVEKFKGVKAVGDELKKFN